MRKYILVLLTIALVYGCSKVPVTGRRQVHLIRESQMIGMSSVAYADFLQQNSPLPASDPRAKRVKAIGDKIAMRVEEYLKDHHQLKRVQGFEWQFEVVDDPTINAWCMPGGKVVVYTGIMNLAGNDDEMLAVVMGHEIAHAIARHGNERMSQGLVVQAGGATLGAVMQDRPGLGRDLFLQSYGLASGLGTLKFSRKHETEADKMGLIFMAMAGYNPEKAVDFWKKMSEMGGEKPPQMLSTHPHDDTRINDLQEFMGEAKWYYNAYKDQN